MAETFVYITCSTKFTDISFRLTWILIDIWFVQKFVSLICQLALRSFAWPGKLLQKFLWTVVLFITNRKINFTFTIKQECESLRRFLPIVYPILVLFYWHMHLMSLSPISARKSTCTFRKFAFDLFCTRFASVNCMQYGIFTHMKCACNAAIPLPVLWFLIREPISELVTQGSSLCCNCLTLLIYRVRILESSHQNKWKLSLRQV